MMQNAKELVDASIPITLAAFGFIALEMDTEHLQQFVPFAGFSPGPALATQAVLIVPT
jgi:hypothetical protein